MKVEDELFLAVGRFTGLAHLEDPKFHDRLRLATTAAPEAPHEIGLYLEESAVAAIAIGGLAGSVLVIWPPMALLLLVIAVPSIAAQLATARHLAEVDEEVTTTLRRRAFFQALLSDVRAGKELRIFGIGAWLHSRLIESLRHATTALLRGERRAAGIQGALALASGAAIAVGALVVIRRALNGALSLGDVVLFLAAAAALQGGFVSILAGIGQVGRSIMAFRSFLDVVSRPDDLASQGHPPVPLAQGVTLEDVWFRYSPEGPWVLQGLSLHIPAGSTFGLVGINGAGKTTVVKLLCRFYDPTRGRILWDGTDIRELDPWLLRARMSVVFQDFMTYDLLAQENIGLGAVDDINNLSAVRTAAREAEIDFALNQLPSGYGTLLSREFAADSGVGVNLSGGEWQRVALARALMRRRPDLLILDEPSSGLDAEAERRIHETITGHALGATRILISHRLSTLRNADTIAVMQNGALCEIGNHKDLLSRDGRYAQLFNLQAEGYAPNDGADDSQGAQ